MEQSFELVSNVSREGRVLHLVLLWLFVALPLLALVSWRVAIAFGPSAASAVGVSLAFGLLIAVGVWYTRAEHLRLSIAPGSAHLLDDHGTLVAALGSTAFTFEVARHEYVGRGTIRIPVLVLRDGARELTIGANTAAEPPGTARRVAAPLYLVDPVDWPRLLAAVAAIRSGEPPVTAAGVGGKD